MSGRCPGCGETDKNADRVREHTRYCGPYKTLYIEHPERVLDPVDEFARWKDEDRAGEREQRRDAVIGEADRRRAEQQARWQTPPDILEGLWDCT